jgi:hypothetical protein
MSKRSREDDEDATPTKRLKKGDRAPSTVCPSHYLNKKSAMCTTEKCIAFAKHNGEFDGVKNVKLKKEMIVKPKVNDENRKIIMKFIRKTCADVNLDLETMYDKIFDFVEKHSNEQTIQSSNVTNQSYQQTETSNVNGTNESPLTSHSTNVKDAQEGASYLKLLNELEELQNEKVQREELQRIQNIILTTKIQKRDKLLSMQTELKDQLDSANLWQDWITQMNNLRQHLSTQQEKYQKQKNNDIAQLISTYEARIKTIDKCRTNIEQHKETDQIQAWQDQLSKLNKTIQEADQSIQEELTAIQVIKAHIENIDAKCELLRKKQ